MLKQRVSPVILGILPNDIKMQTMKVIPRAGTLSQTSDLLTLVIC